MAQTPCRIIIASQGHNLCKSFMGLTQSTEVFSGFTYTILPISILFCINDFLFFELSVFIGVNQKGQTYSYIIPFVYTLFQVLIDINFITKLIIKYFGRKTFTCWDRKRIFFFRVPLFSCSAPVHKMV